MANTSLPVSLLLDLAHPGRRPSDWEVRPSTLRALWRTGALAAHILRHPSARLLVEDLQAPPPLSAVLATRFLTAGPAWVEDRAGARLALGPVGVTRQMLAWLADLRAAARVVPAAERMVTTLERIARAPRRIPSWAPASGVLFLRTDLCHGVLAGGSLAHLAGVLNQLQQSLGAVDLVTSDPIPLLDPAIHVNVVKPEPRTWTQVELHRLNHNTRMISAAAAVAAGKPGGLIYQRYSLHNWTGVSVARQFNLRFVLEFNGPEPWVAENWSRPLRYVELARRIEQLNLDAADLVVVVSEALRTHLLARGIADDRIIVIPNGVDTTRYAPDVDGSSTRARFELADRCVIGFIGTFGPWHGAAILAEAFAMVLEMRPDLRDRVRLLLIGDGMCLPAVKDLLAKRNRLAEVAFTGLVPQSEGNRYLAACDIVVLPTVPNPDGTQFFGSPTKLFEYMAMGRAIAASAIGQVSNILHNERTALLIPPADPAGLAQALIRLIDDHALRARLGSAARVQAELRHSWVNHVSRLLERIKTLG